MMLLLAVACAPAPEPEAAPDATGMEVRVVPPAGVVPLAGPLLLRRMSLDLRGVLPSVEELDAVEADPSRVDAYRDAFLDDPRLEERLVRLFGESWHTRIDEMPLYIGDYGLTETDTYRFHRAAGDEPLRLMAHVAMQDRPWTEVVTADYTVANDLLVAMFSLVDTAPGSGTWREARYTDQRPPVGVLATNGLWWRYLTTPFNHNRTRAAAITRLLLCDDYLARPVSFASSPALLDVDGTTLATTTDPACLACHATLDPIAQLLFGFWPYAMYDPLEIARYHPEREPLGEEYLSVEGAYFGVPVDGLADLGPQIAADPRFARCAVQTVAEALWRRDTELGDSDQLEVLRRGFVGNGQLLRPMMRAVTDTLDYRAGALDGTASAETADRVVTRRMLSVDQLASALGDLTGFSWEYEGYDQLDNDTYGYRVMAGGVDGMATTRPAADPSVTWALTTATAAEGAGAAVAAALGSTPLLPGVTAETRPGDPAFTDALRTVHWRVFATRPDAAWEADMTALWTEVEATDGPDGAWTAVLATVLRDPAFLTY